MIFHCCDGKPLFPSRLDALTLIRFLVVAFIAIDLVINASFVPAQSAPRPVLDWIDEAGGDRKSANDLRIEEVPDSGGPRTWSVTTIGGDPYLWFRLPALEASNRDWLFTVEYFCPSGVQNPQWFVGFPATPAAAIDTPAIEPAEGWTNYSLNLSKRIPDRVASGEPVWVRWDLGGRSGVNLRMRAPIVRPMNDQEQRARENALSIRQQKIALATAISQYSQRDWPAVIGRVQASDGVVHVRGRWTDPKPDQGKLRLVRRRGDRTSASAILAEEVAGGVDVPPLGSEATFEVPMPRGSGATGRYQLVRIVGDRIEPVSACRYIDNPDQNARDLSPPPRLSAAKGLTCLDTRFSAKQLRDLGLKHGSVNVLINGLLDTEANPQSEPFQVGNRTWHFNKNRMRGLDANVRLANEAGLQVAAILLVAGREGGDPMVHPEFDPAGTYSMPNLTTPDSVALYDATLRFLADRYSQDDGEYGRVDHWIVHNEVDYGWQWTNMGNQPLDVFADHYVRSMRMVDAAVRTFNPHGRVFISLTHRWNVPDDRPWKTYAPRSLIIGLLRASENEGDFPWGVAYHPYPESLWDAATWDDGAVADDFDTRLITIKNLQVLDRFMHQRTSMTADGKVRPVICSEQGFHAAEDDPEQLQVQAAALLYTWQQLRRCPSIIAFDYHRPVDHPREGGLRLGLRGLPDSDHPIGQAKPAWDVFRAIGTDDEAALIRRYQGRWQSEPSER